MLLGVDVGGTFTDAVLAVDGRLVTAKTPTTPADQSEGVMAAAEAVLSQARRGPQEITAFAHGMTVATNALLEGKVARTALVATEGFTDIIALGRQNRPELYRLCAAWPPPLAPHALRFKAPERMTPEGPIRPLEPQAAEALAAEVAPADPDAVAVVLLHSYSHPEHEREIGRALAEALPDAHISLSHEVVGTFREFERAATTEVDAALSPLLRSYLRRLVERARGGGLPEPTIMQSNGGLIDAATAASHASWTVLSGPAGGTSGAAFVARQAGAPDALCFDMGGTSCDVCVVEGGSVHERGTSSIAGRPLSLPAVAVHTVGAGGGSVAWSDPGGALRVGPRSSGADPGPACYGRGGTEPTVTDANLLLGYLAPDRPLAGEVRLDRRLAEDAVADLGRCLGLDPIACAEGIIRVANAEMLRALRVVTVQRGIDPRGYALLAFGGAGPLHAGAIADELQIDHILCPQTSGVLAALGLVVSPRRRDSQRTALLSGDQLTADNVAAVVEELGAQGRGALGEERAEISATYELRYRGQAFELPVSAGPSPQPDELIELFAALHEDRYGYRDPEQEVELITIRVTAIMPGAEVDLAGASQTDPEVPVRGSREAVLGGMRVEVETIRGMPPPETRIAAPAVVELPESTILIPPRWSGEVDHAGTVHLRRDRE
ncbi:MAG: hydantoinase/oxoprolinase family protein [Solirubrobacterales bacterium]|nr:hydantoinase/oxoprolinase family protein [Solirubrobacterales bacterium]